MSLLPNLLFLAQVLISPNGAPVCESQATMSQVYTQQFQSVIPHILVTTTPEEYDGFIEALTSLVDVDVPEDTAAASFLVPQEPGVPVLMLEFDATDCFIGYREIGRTLWDDTIRILLGQEPLNNNPPIPDGQRAL